ncbi:MAG: HEPN domain-containing protein [Candidatus Margulisiibacteriota bacterium]
MNVLEIQEWLETIKHDTATVELIIKENGYADIGIYHIHQAVEKYLKILFLLKTKDFPKVHFLDRLSSILIETYPQIEQILKELLFIDKFLPKLRYPVSDKLEKENLLECWSQFQKIQTVIKKIISENLTN